LRSTLNIPGAPRAIGPYAQAQVVRLHGGNRMVFTSGQIALDPDSGELVQGGIAAETERVLNSLSALMQGSGLALDDVVKTTVYLVEMNDFQEMNRVYEKYFSLTLPARTTLAVAALPRGARVEIDAVAMGRDF
jgi:2-iminobutanoate/2-iminopropanoate deaminase